MTMRANLLLNFKHCSSSLRFKTVETKVSDYSAPQKNSKYRMKSLAIRHSFVYMFRILGTICAADDVVMTLIKSIK